MGDDDGSWLSRLAINLVSYSVVLVPSAVIVFAVKKGLCVRSVSDNFLVRLFVFGKNETIVNYGSHNDSDSKETLLPVTVKNGTDAKNKHSFAASLRSREVFLILYCFLGLQVSYLSWGLLQEKIMTTVYHKEKQDGEDLEVSHAYTFRFTNSQFLVLVNRVLAIQIAFAALNFKNWRNRSRYEAHNEPPLYQYIYCSLSNILSSWCQYEALKFVSFPTQVLSKACKIMPVMLMSQLVGGKKYKTSEYVFALSISLGMTLFLWSDHSVNSSAHQKTASNSSDHYYAGLVILVLYLTFDSFTSNWQTVLFTKYKMSTFHMMAAVNFFSILLTSTSLTEQGDLWPALQLLLQNKSLLTDCLLLSIFSAIGQLFVFYTISTFGALVFVTIMTLRQAMAILLSCIVYDHSLAPIGLIGVIIVFVTLFTQIYWKSKSKR